MGKYRASKGLRFIQFWSYALNQRLVREMKGLWARLPRDRRIELKWRKCGDAIEAAYDHGLIPRSLGAHIPEQAND